MEETSKIRLQTLLGAAGVGFGASFIAKVVKFRGAAGKSVEIGDPPTAGNPAFARLIEALAQAPQRPGNHVKVLRNGHEIFPAMLEGINSATESICLSAYIFWAGEAATDIGNALATKAREGLEIRLLLDSWGSAKLKRDVVKMLQEAGVDVQWFRPFTPYQLGKANNRMHRRIMVIDGCVAYAGGVGIAEQWEGNCEEPGSWRETHLRIEGPAVRDLVGGFLENWAETTGEVLGPKYLPVITPFKDGIPILVTRSSASAHSTAAENLFLAAIAGARKRLWITTAYFAPQANYIDALCGVAQSGVDVRVLLNGREIDKEVVRKAGQRSYGRLLEAGVQLFEYQKARLHAKVILVDDRWANVGSANFDNRSLALEEEINVSIDDQVVVEELADHFLDDCKAAKKIELERWRNRPVLARVGEIASETVRQSL